MLQKFADMKVGTRIITGYIIALVLMAIVGGVSIWRISDIGNTMDTLVNEVAMDRQYANQISERILEVRLRVNQYLREPTAERVAAVDEVWTRYETLLAEADAAVVNPERMAILDNILEISPQYDVAFESIAGNMEERAAILADLDVAVRRVEDNAAQLMENASLARMAYDLQVSMTRLRVDVASYQLYMGDPIWSDRFNARYDDASMAMGLLGEAITSSQDRQIHETTQAELLAIKNGLTAAKALYDEEIDLAHTVLDVVGPKAGELGGEIVASARNEFQAAAAETQNVVNQTIFILLGIIAVAVVVGISLGIYISRTITKPLDLVAFASKQIAETDLVALVDRLTAMADGDLTRSDFTPATVRVDVNSKDELGSMAESFNMIIDQMHMTSAAFSDMSTNLRDLIRSVQEGINDVTTSSSQLNDAAGQAGQATAQIAETVGHVAAANTQQNHSLENTRRVIEMQTQAIMGIAEGAQKQAHAVEEANRTLTKRLGHAVSQVQSATEESSVVVAGTAQETKNGAAIVSKTVNGMKLIASKSELVADRVAEMGERSKEIGTIVNAIEAIAERTNLLALNAAIEAARAGEHGKGFAVVADEVRKLAEQASRATAEVGTIVHAVQQVAEQAMNAMKESRHEVDNGMEMANETGEVLGRIQSSVNQVEQQIAKLSQSVVDMTGGNEELSRLMMEVAAIVEENSASAEEIAASSNEVMQSVEDLSAISEENSASTEQVSASTEEVSAQVDQTAASANMLAQMAQSLMEQVSRFRIEEGAARPAASTRFAPMSNGSSNGSSRGNGSHKESVAKAPAYTAKKKVISLN